MNDVAIIGSGIAGLGCVHFLNHAFRLTLYEREPRAGGHANTLEIREGGRTFPVDTGFMVYNEATYPLLTRLFASLGVATKPAPMSFSVCHEQSGIEYRGTNLDSLFAQRRNLLRPRFWRLLRSILRFNREARVALESGAIGERSLGEFLCDGGFDVSLRELYLVPMGAAIWSSPAEEMLRFPAETFIRFFHNHGFLGVSTHHQWRTVEGGARTYVRKLLDSSGARVRLASPVRKVERRAGGVFVHAENGEVSRHDHVIFACHADQALSMLANPDRVESRTLGSFSYQPNVATVHADPSVMPRARKAWASWNYRVPRGLEKGRAPSVHYWMNSLQGVPSSENCFVSLNAEERIDSSRVLRTLQYRHPLFDLDAIRAQRDLPELNARPEAQVSFCGSYFRYGFHEDALLSAFELSRQLLGREPRDGAGLAAGASRTASHPPQDRDTIATMNAGAT